MKILNVPNWDAGHKTGSEYRYLVDEYISEGLSWEEFLEEYHDVNNYQVEDSHENRSHAHALKK
jgi:hypothetical protein